MMTVGFMFSGGEINCPAARPIDGEKRYSNRVKYLSGGTNDNVFSLVHFCNLRQSHLQLLVKRKQTPLLTEHKGEKSNRLVLELF